MRFLIFAEGVLLSDAYHSQVISEVSGTARLLNFIYSIIFLSGDSSSLADYMQYITFFVNIIMIVFYGTMGKSEM